MGHISQDGYYAKKLSLFLKVWTFIVVIFKRVGSKIKYFLAPFCRSESEYVAESHVGPPGGSPGGPGARLLIWPIILY